VRCKESLAQRSRSSREQDEHPNPLQNDTSTTVPYEYTIASYFMIANIHFCCFILFFCEKVAESENTTTKKICSNDNFFFVGWLHHQPPLQWASSGPTIPDAPTNQTVGAAGGTSCPYKWVDLHSITSHPYCMICRGGSVTSRPYKCCTCKWLQPHSFSSGRSLLHEKRLERHWAPPKNCSTKGMF
jgi:hypothetical protein